ncbi:hypothetical protein DFJ73DRAFT_758306 [Zopfochytrium polystomum]|nr:hypothetical protein DFJ73DRAFT_758306 [Zopfochytrium polystomum]
MVVIWGFSALVVWFLILGFFLYGSYHKTKTNRDKTIKVWQRRLQLCCFGHDSHITDSKDVLKDVAAELADYFKDVDWAPTDLAVGLILLKREQKRVTEIRQARRLIVEKPAGFLIPTVDSTDTLTELALVSREGLRRRELAAAPRNSVADLATNADLAVDANWLKVEGGESRRAEGSLESGGRTRVNTHSTSSGSPEPLAVPFGRIVGDFAANADQHSTDMLNKKLLTESAVALMELAASVPPSDFTSHPDTIIIIGIDGERTTATNAEMASQSGTDTTRPSSSPSQSPVHAATSLSPPSPPQSSPTGLFASSAQPFNLLRGLNQHSSTSTSQNNTKFKPWLSRKKRRMGHHRLHRRKDFERGSVTREEIDDILHYARYAEVIYDDEDIALSINAERLIRHSPHNDLYKSPYLIVHDSETDSLVIAIRGTYSAADVLVDLKFNLVEIDIPELAGQRENGTVHFAHEGMLTSAMNIVNELKELDVLGPLLKDPQSQYYECGLVVTGHSLGAGVAALLACMLRPDFPTTCCYAFEPPGCLVSAEVAEYLESFCTSVVMGDDLVPRLSRNTMEMLKMDVARLIRSCDHPKWKIFGSVLGARICFRSSRLAAGKEKVERPGLLHRRTPSGKLQPEDLALLRRRTNSLRAGRSSKSGKELFDDMAMGLGQLPSTPMFVPGRILYIEKFRRPPLSLNEAIGGAIDLAKVRTKAVGDKILDGAEKLKDGAGEIKDMLLDGAEGIKERLGGRARRDEEGLPDGNEDVSPTEAPMRRRTGSIGDALHKLSPSISRSKSLGDIIISSEEIARRREQLHQLQMQQSHTQVSPSEQVPLNDDTPHGEDTPARGRRRQAPRKPFRSKSVEGGLDRAIFREEDAPIRRGTGKAKMRHGRSASRRRSDKRYAAKSPQDRSFGDSERFPLDGVPLAPHSPEHVGSARRSSQSALSQVELSTSAVASGEFTKLKKTVASKDGDDAIQHAWSLPNLEARRGSSSRSQENADDEVLDPQTMRRAASETRGWSKRSREAQSSQAASALSVRGAGNVSGAGGSDSAVRSEFPGAYVVPLAVDAREERNYSRDADDPTNEATDLATDLPNPTSMTMRRYSRRVGGSEGRVEFEGDFIISSPGDIRGNLRASGDERTVASGKKPAPLVLRTESPTRLSMTGEPRSVRTGRKSSHTSAMTSSPTSVSSPEEIILSKPQYPPSYPNKKTGHGKNRSAAQPDADGEKAANGQGMPRRHGKYHYIPRWATRFEFQEITISRSMVNDHFPFGLMREFQAAPPGSVLGVVTRD